MELFGYDRQDITPPVGSLLYGYDDRCVSDHIHDRLRVHAFAFSQGARAFLMISAEVCIMQTALATKIRARIAEETDVRMEHILLCATHTHTGPNTDGNTGWGALDTAYCERIFIPNTVLAAKNALNNRKKALVGYHVGKSHIGVNRREQDIHNNLLLGQCAWGSYDPRMAVFAFRGEDGAPLANLVCYACHGTCAGYNTGISRDWSGGMLDMLEAHTGAPAAFFCGPAGDVGPRLASGRTTGDMRDVEAMGKKAGEDAVAVFQGITEYRPLQTAVTAGMLRLPLKKRLSQADAEDLLAPVRDKTINLEAQTRAYCERVLRSYEEGYEEKDCCYIPQTAVAIGDCVFASFPFELFSDIALRINREIKDCEVFSLSYTNGSEGYFPCHAELSKGGYEVQMYQTARIQPYADYADWHLAVETLRNLGGLPCTE